MGNFTSSYREFADRVLAAADIVEVVGQYVELKRAGSNMKACCPFHQEKTPSFNVHPGKQIFKCFGCGKGGDVISFVREIERVEFHEALKILAEKYSLEVPNFQAKGRSEEQIRHRQSLNELMERAADYYQGRLADPAVGAQVRRYLEDRGLAAETTGRFRLGMADESWDGLVNHLKRQGYTESSMAEAGVARKKKSGAGYIDYLRDRLIFPITNARGATIAFGGRLLRGDGPKYLNTSETALFHKGRELYGLFQARDAITRENQPVVLVEGYMDVIGCRQAGVTGAVASMGTALTPEQARLIRRYSHDAVFLYDADEAGIKAILRGLEILVGANLSVRVGLMPSGEDPDSYAQKHGAEALRTVVEKAIPFFDFLLEQAGERYDLTSPESSVGALEIFQPVLAAMSEKLVRDGYITKLAVKLGHDEETLRLYLKEHAPRKPVRRPAAERAAAPARTAAPLTSGGSEPPLPDAPPPGVDVDYDPENPSEEGPDYAADAAGAADAAPEAAPAAGVLPVGAEPPTAREKGLLRILIEHADARVEARRKLDPRWIENVLVRHWAERILEMEDSVVDAWPVLMKQCEAAPEHQEFLHSVVFSIEEPLDTDYLSILENLTGLLESNFRLAQNRRLNQRIARMVQEKNVAGIGELNERQMENMNRRLRRRKEATTEPTSLGA